MKISKLFHWLYAALMFLPLVVMPIFAIYSHRHTIDSYEVTVPQNEVVNFNQVLKNGDFENAEFWTAYYGTFSVLDNNSILVSSSNNDGTLVNYDITYNVNHKYFLSFYAKSSTSSEVGVGIEMLNSGSPYHQFFSLIQLDNSLVHYSILFTPLYNAENSSFPLCFRHYAPIDSELTLSNIWLTDLTVMFGSGNEPNIEQFNTWYPNDYYEYNTGTKQLLKGVSTVTYDNSDIGSQFLFNLYITTDKYLNFDEVLSLGAISDWIELNVFNGNAPLVFTIVWHYLDYWLILSIFWLCFDVLIYVPQIAHRWLDKASLE